MRLEFVTAQLQEAYTTRDNLRRDRNALLNHLQASEEQQSLNELQIRTLKVLISQPDGVEIKAYTRPPFSQASLEDQFLKQESKPTPPAKKKATKKR